MALQINQYTKIRTNLTLDNDDLMDLDSTDDAGVSYESAKMTVANLLAFVNANAVNIYIADGTIGGNRTLTANGNWTKWLLGDVKVANVGDGNSFGFVVEFGVLEMGRFNYDVPSTSANIELKHLILGVPTTYLNASNGLVDITGNQNTTGVGVFGSASVATGNGTKLEVVGNTNNSLSFRVTDITGVTGESNFGVGKDGVGTNYYVTLGVRNGSDDSPFHINRQTLRGSAIGNQITMNAGGVSYGIAIDRFGTNSLDFFQDIAANRQMSWGYATTPVMTLDLDVGLGIGIAAPTSKLHVQGGTPSTTKTLLIENSLLNPNLVVQDDGFVGIGTATPTKELEVNGDIIAGNTELTSQFGAALFGYKGYGATNFAIIQDASGLTGINAPTGQPIEMRINNSVKYSVIGGEFRGNSDLGMKIGVFLGTVGLGVQTNLLEFINPAITSDFTFGYGTSGSLTKQMTILGTGEVGIGTSTPNASAKLEIESTTQGFLKPRMTTVQRDAVLTPTAGLEVYNTTTNKMNFYNGSAWEAITSA